MAKILTNTLTDILIETPRLLIGSIIPEAERATPIKSDICATLYQDVFSDPDVMRYLLEGRCLSHEDTQAYIASHFSSSDNQLGLKGVIEKTSGSLIGFCGMLACDDFLHQLEKNNATTSYQYLTNTNRPAPSEDILLAVELGYALSRKYWGRGYAYRDL